MINKVPGKIDFIELEHQVLEKWEKEDTFNKLREKNAGGPRFSFLDGPITANNPMGVHHAWGRTLKDMYQRFWAMKGYELRYQNGFDCQGLWVEVEVEKDLKFNSKRDIEKFGIDKFVEKCKERVRKYSKIQSDQSIRLGYWMDWDNSYYTYSDENNYTIWLFLKKCHERGLIYKGDDVMPWCPRCGTALSEHEIATEGYKEVEHPSIFVLFPLVDKENEYLLVWTTTPWTLAANVSAAVREDLEYARVSTDGKILYLAKSRLEILPQGYEVTDTLKGSEMIGWGYSAPFGEVPAQEGVSHEVIIWDDVSEEEGTGIVHIAPGCGREDYALSKEYDLAVIKTLDEEGSYIEGFGDLTGLNVSDINEEIFSRLEDKNILYDREIITHRYPVCWRCNTEVVFRLVDEWFISMDPLRQEIMDVTKKITWMPSFGLDRELDWLRNMHDWNISKKRYWGLALPIYECSSCGEVTVIGGKEELMEAAVEGWDEFEGHSPHRPWIDSVIIACPKCGENTRRIPDVGNPWLDAGIVAYSTLAYSTDREYWEKWFPADFITESFPGQFRNWFYSLLAMSTVMENREPFKRVLGHALVKDEQGKDMHKSAGNAIPFDKAAEEMGVDVLRWIYVSQNPFNNLLFGYGLADDVRKKILTLWNVYTFFTTYASIDDYTPRGATKVSERNELDRWLIAKTHELIKNCTADMEAYNPMLFMRRIDAYLEDLSNWYVRRSRRRFWKSTNDRDKLCAYDTLYEAIVTLTKLLAPVLPFITESIHGNLVNDQIDGAPESVHLTDYPVSDPALIDEKLIEEIDTVKKAVELGRAARNIAQIKVRQPLNEIFFVPSEGVNREILTELSHQVLEELNIHKLTIVDDPSEFVKLTLNPNFKHLGPKFGKDAHEIVESLKTKNPEEIRNALQTEGSYLLKLDGREFKITEDLISFDTVEKDNIAVVHDNDMITAIDTLITPELARQGIVRDLVHDINNIRKEADFDVSDRINLYLRVGEGLLKAITEHETFVAEEVLAETLSFEFDKGEFSKEITVGGETATVGIKRVSTRN